MVRRYAPKSRRPKRYGTKKYNRRFKRKRFARNSVNQLSMRAPLASRLLRVKFPWVETETVQIAPNAATSICYQGNALCPTTAAGLTAGNTPAAGDTIASGAIEYSNFYDRYTINGSSINIEIVNRNVNAPQDGSFSSSGLIRACLMAIPFTANITGTAGNDDWTAVRTQLDSYNYEQLLAWPYAKWRMLGSNSGGASRLRFKMFRKTKSMTGVKDLRDNYQFIANMANNGSTAITNGVTNPVSGFMYYLRLFAEAPPGTNQSIAITSRMSLYTTMYQREFNPIRTLTTV